MSFTNLLNQLTGSSSSSAGPSSAGQGVGNALSGITSKIPGGLAGGAMAGGVMALLMGNKSARKVAGKAATYGGAAVLGGIAYKAYKNWQQNNASAQAASPQAEAQFSREAAHEPSSPAESADFQLILIKAMIASARADGVIDGQEHQRLFGAIEEMNLPANTKASIIDWLNKPISIHELINPAHTLEQKSEIYLASCIVIDLDDNREYAHLSQLAKALALPDGLEGQLRRQAQQALLEVA